MTAGGSVAQQLTQALQAALAPQRLLVIDDSAAHAGHAGAREGAHFRVDIVADSFRGLRLLQRHRLVYTAVAELMRPGGIHALSIAASSPDERREDSSVTF